MQRSTFARPTAGSTFSSFQRDKHRDTETQRSQRYLWPLCFLSRPYGWPKRTLTAVRPDYRDRKECQAGKSDDAHILRRRAQNITQPHQCQKGSASEKYKVENAPESNS